MQNQEFSNEVPSARTSASRDAESNLSHHVWDLMGQGAGKLGADKVGAAAAGADTLSRGDAATVSKIMQSVGNKIEGNDLSKNIENELKTKRDDMCIDLTINIYDSPKSEPGVEHKNNPFDKYHPHIGYGNDIRPTIGHEMKTK
ncbi:hypothetical protein BH11CYA1_BH11CYA1_00820 [soil metagenome]